MSDENANAGTGDDDEELETGVETETDAEEEVEETGTDAEEEVETEEEPEVEVEEQPTRTGRRAGGSEEIKRLRRRAQQAERERDEARRSGQQTQQPQKSQAQIAEEERAERERVSLLPPEEQITYWRTKDRQEFGNALRGLASQQADERDASKFDRLCAREPGLAAIQDDVEDEIKKARANGNFAVTREDVANWFLGKRARERAGRARGNQTRRAAAGRERETARPGTTRSDVAATRRPRADSTAARDKRVEGYEI